ncbi:AzlC family ABC transporter permease [Natronosalvus rutilus]|uniref:AzlC family ABC transporter permease n=1 Tax=Natronosalvus rutilus TaxID=2953753 RepID=A0A9E7ND80_9EURY|nr:AzlC family ABC transporter permease [Natronosalvus rutilus]UTF55755.1 AzlC family ABC transporter permease [Natronosalvus rutilus]
MSARTDFVDGLRACAPLMLGMVPFAIITGVTAVNVGISPILAVAMSVVVFAGAAQLAAIDLIGQSAPIVVVVFTAIIVNLRFMMYSASIAPYLSRYSTLSKWFSAYVLTDLAYALSVTEFAETTPDERSRKWFYLGTAMMLWITWQVGTVVGVLLGANVPAGLSLEFAIPLTFMALLFPVLKGRPTAITALVAGFFAVITDPLPFNLGLVVAAGIGILVGVTVECLNGEFPSTQEFDDATDGGESA